VLLLTLSGTDRKLLSLSHKVPPNEGLPIFYAVDIHLVLCFSDESEVLSLTPYAIQCQALCRSFSYALASTRLNNPSANPKWLPFDFLFHGPSLFSLLQEQDNGFNSQASAIIRLSLISYLPIFNGAMFRSHWCLNLCLEIKRLPYQMFLKGNPLSHNNKVNY
jgi:hypothetical protein